MPATVLFFLVTVAYWPGTLSAAVAPRWAVLIAGVPVALILAPRGRDQWLGIASWLWVTWLGCAALSLIWAPDPMAGLDAWVHLLALFGAFTVGAAYGARPVVLGVALGLVPSLLIVPLDAGGLFWNKNVFAEVACLVAVFFVAERRYLLALPFAAGVLEANSRAAIAALAIGILASPQVTRFWRVAALSLGLVLVAFFTLVQHWGLSGLFIRAGMWSYAWQGLSWSGHGLGAFAANYPLWEHVHNDFLEVAYELGVVSVVPAALLAYVLVMQPRVHRYPDYYAGEHVAPRAAVLAVATVALVAFPLSSPAAASAAAAMAGYLCCTRGDVRLHELASRVAHILGVGQAGDGRRAQARG